MPRILSMLLKKLSLLIAIILSLSVANTLSEVLLAEEHLRNDGDVIDDGNDDDTNILSANEEEERPSWETE